MSNAGENPFQSPQTVVEPPVSEVPPPASSWKPAPLWMVYFNPALLGLGLVLLVFVLMRGLPLDLLPLFMAWYTFGWFFVIYQLACMLGLLLEKPRGQWHHHLLSITLATACYVVVGVLQLAIGY